MKKNLKILIAETSPIVSKGIFAILKQCLHNAEVFTAADLEQTKKILFKQNIDILIINPSLIGIFGVAVFKKSLMRLPAKFAALQSALMENNFIKDYDAAISIYDSEETIKRKIVDLINDDEKDEQQDMLSAREKDIVVEVVNGLTNKQIADKLCLSVHTVITHRRNIASKLQIHSAAGLTIYAISNKLFEVKS